MSQRVWSCACGWRSIAENVGGPGLKGEAPPHCRRCRGTRLAVTTEKHPSITHVCKRCREDFLGHPGATHCAKCRPVVRGLKIWDGRRKYVWTPERDQLLRDHYRSNATAIAKRFFPGWPKWVIAHRAQALGLCRTKEKPWTKAEDAFLLEWVGVHTPHWIAKQLRTRTVTAIIVRLKRLHVSRRIQADGLTMGQLEQALGVDHRMIVGWFRSGRLKGIYRTNPNEHERYEFQERDVAAFLLENPSHFRLDRVDQAWFMGLMRDAVAGSHGEQRPSASSKPTQQLVACVGVDDDTPCPAQKYVAPRGRMPARCPDCTLELRRRLRLEELGRLKRINGARLPAELVTQAAEELR